MFRVRDNRFSPVLKKGDVAAINRLSYRMDLFFLDTPIWHDAPKRGDLIRYVDGTWTCRTGLILGLPGEDVEITGGILTVDSYPYVAALPLGLQLTGDVPLTFVDRSYILVATLNLGAVVGVYHVPVGSIIGKVHRLF